MNDKRTQNSRICIITTGKKNYSETFIRNHIQYLPFTKKILYKGLSPVLYDWETDLPISNPVVYKIKEKLFYKGNKFDSSSYVANYLRKYLIKNKIQAVLAEFGPVGVNVSKACLSANIPLIVHFHGDDAHSQGFLDKYAVGYRELGQTVAAVVCVSEIMKTQLISIGIPEHKIQKIVYGIDISLFKGGKPAEAPPVFLAVGRFVNKKAPHLTILAFQKVVKKIPDAKLIMIGTGELLPACRALIRALHLETNVTLKGVCEQREVQQFMQQSRAFLMHSITPETGEKEGTPLSILEASAIGLPIISTYHAGISEAVIHNKTGFLVDEYDVENMTKYMIDLAQNPDLAQKMGEEGRKHIAHHYELKQQINKLATLIEGEI